jgi:DNA polymerase III subunit gamma/tau
VAAEVWYRKWRPQTFVDTVGQRHVTDTLARAVALGRVAHAYLFCGPRGTGKTTTARLLAKAVNCEHNGEGQPCGHCASCVAIAEGRALDLIEMDAASNRGIDEIRSLREKVGYSPTESRYKVYIIDEVHELTAFAFDALLKTLEEPPPHVIFVLATTEAHKVPETILSRCQRFDFVRIKLADVVGRLRQICEAEGVEADDAALQLIGRRTGGALRDAVNVLEQTVASQGQRLSEDGVRAAIGGRGDARATELVRHLVAKDLPAALTLVAAVCDDGVEPRRFAADVLESLRALLLVRAGAGALLDLSANETERLNELAGTSQVADLLRAAKLIAATDFRADPQSPLPLELAIVEFATAVAQPAAASTAQVAAATQARATPVRPAAAANPPAGATGATPSAAPTAATATRANAEPVAQPAAQPPAARPAPAPARATTLQDRIRRTQSLGQTSTARAESASPQPRVPANPDLASATPRQDQEAAPAAVPATAAIENVSATVAAAGTNEVDVAVAADVVEAASDGAPVVPVLESIHVIAPATEPMGEAIASAASAFDITEAASDAAGVELEAARRRFREIYEQCRKINRTASGYLNSRCDIVDVSNGTVTFAIISEVLAKRAAESSNSQAIADAASKVLGGKYGVAFVVRTDVVSRMETLSDERPSHLLDEAKKNGAVLVSESRWGEQQ